MKKTYGGQITVEVAIVTPIIMFIVFSLIYLTMYIHDVVAIRAYAYGLGNQYAEKEFSEFQKNVLEGIHKIPLFVISPKINFEEGLDSYLLKIRGRINMNILWIQKLVAMENHIEEICIEKSMSTEILYVTHIILNDTDQHEIQHNDS